MALYRAAGPMCDRHILPFIHAKHPAKEFLPVAGCSCFRIMIR
jgi:hypothetical protein